MEVLLIGILIAYFVYWVIRENQTSNVNHSRSGHTDSDQLLIKYLLPHLAILVVILQLMGYDLTYQFSGIAVQVFGLHLFIGGLFISIWAREIMDENWAHAADYQVIPGQNLVKQGPFAVIRHPIYLGLFSAFIGVELIISSWLVLMAVPVIVFFYWQAQKEELLLSKVFGSNYLSYMKETDMFVPGII